MMRENIESMRDFIRCGGSTIADACRFNGFQRAIPLAENCSIALQIDGERCATA
jgi:hypothetical protein